jgi:hypothetical protein
MLASDHEYLCPLEIGVGLVNAAPRERERERERQAERETRSENVHDRLIKNSGSSNYKIFLTRD